MNIPLTEIITWIGIAFCVSQSAMFSGMNLALFSISRLRLEAEAATGSSDAEKLLQMRDDSNFLLTTVLWGNVGINVLLTLLSNSVLAGVSAFIFSTVIITFAGEILPQAYFSRNALRMAALLAPVLKFYQFLLYPFAKSSSKILDLWLGKESIQYFRESNLREVIKKHIEADEADIDRMEGLGALNFLAIDDLLVVQEGETVDPLSIVSLPFEEGNPLFPKFEHSASDPFLQQVQQSGKKWVILTEPSGEPRLVLDSDGFIRHALFETSIRVPKSYCHRPILIKDTRLRLGDVIWRLKVHPEHSGDDVIDQDIILIWGTEKRIITGSDILGRLMRGIVRHEAGCLKP